MGDRQDERRTEDRVQLPRHPTAGPLRREIESGELEAHFDDGTTATALAEERESANKSPATSKTTRMTADTDRSRSLNRTTDKESKPKYRRLALVATPPRQPYTLSNYITWLGVRRTSPRDGTPRVPDFGAETCTVSFLFSINRVFFCHKTSYTKQDICMP